MYLVGVMAKDLKYGNVILEYGDVGVDEPVFIFRAQDKLTPEVLRHYLGICATQGSPPRHLRNIIDNIVVIETWQKDNFTKIPESKEH